MVANRAQRHRHLALVPLLLCLVAGSSWALSGVAGATHPNPSDLYVKQRRLPPTSYDVYFQWSAPSVTTDQRITYCSGTSCTPAYSTNVLATPSASARDYTFPGDIGAANYCWAVWGSGDHGTVNPSNVVCSGGVQDNSEQWFPSEPGPPPPPPPPPSPPGTPSIQSLTPSDTQMLVAWSDVEGEDNYRVSYRRSNVSTWTNSSNLAAGVTSHQVVGLTPGRSYDFYVRAINTNGNSDSATMSATTTVDDTDGWTAADRELLRSVELQAVKGREAMVWASGLSVFLLAGLVVLSVRR